MKQSGHITLGKMMRGVINITVLIDEKLNYKPSQSTYFARATSYSFPSDA